VSTNQIEVKNELAFFFLAPLISDNALKEVDEFLLGVILQIIFNKELRCHCLSHARILDML